MTMFLIQSAILLAIAFVLGAIVGCLLKRIFASDDATIPVATAAVATAAAASSYIPKAETAPKPEPLPEPAPAMAAPVMATPIARKAVAAKPKAVAKSKTVAKLQPPQKAKSAPKATLSPAVALSVKDDLKLIVGIGPVNERKLNAHGVSSFAQIAGWKKPDIIDAEKYLEFDGRIEREEWVRQAKKLAAGGKSEGKAELTQKTSVAKATVMDKPASSNPGTKAVVLSTVKASKAPSAKSTAVGLIASGKPVKSIAATEKSVPAITPAKPAKTKAAATNAKKPAKSALVKQPKQKTVTKSAPAKKPMAVKLAKPVGGKPDNLTLINGIGNVIEKKLHDMGVFHFAQVANWNDEQAAHFSKVVGFPGRAKREGWMKEAALFAKGGTTEHARKVEAGGIPTSRKSTKAEKGKK